MADSDSQRSTLIDLVRRPLDWLLTQGARAGSEVIFVLTGRENMLCWPPYDPIALDSERCYRQHLAALAVGFTYTQAEYFAEAVACNVSAEETDWGSTLVDRDDHVNLLTYMGYQPEQIEALALQDDAPWTLQEIWAEIDPETPWESVHWSFEVGTGPEDTYVIHGVQRQPVELGFEGDVEEEWEL